MSPLVQVKNVTKTFSAGKKLLGKKSVVHAVNRISFDMVQGETFSIVGESVAENPPRRVWSTTFLRRTAAKSGSTANKFPR